MPNLVLVEFDLDAAPRDGSGVQYVKGQRVQMSRDSARHWTTRNKAHEVEAVVEKEPPSLVPMTPRSRRGVARQSHGKNIVAGDIAGATQGVSDDG